MVSSPQGMKRKYLTGTNEHVVGSVGQELGLRVKYVDYHSFESVLLLTILLFYLTSILKCASQTMLILQVLFIAPVIYYYAIH